ncbi:glycosyl hydrolase [Aspergillus karnatakaensis]|uniref:glycosyl hydrolase n=1 Tax=Aspergillus karnatakaensis TaxID=1810916 RepID=UPI003CCD552F
MRFTIPSTLCSLLALAIPTITSPSPLTTYTNPLLPGWHSDPSCIYVSTLESFFCVTSTFIAYPGLPLYTSKDLQSWSLASNIFNRPSQIPDLANTTNQQGGIYAPTLRYKDGTFYLIVSNLGPTVTGLLFTSTDPYNDNSWSDPLVFDVFGIDPDIFFDTDGKAYVSSADNNMIHHYSLDLGTGEIGPVSYLWNGTGGAYPEGPHIYFKDSFYYLLIAEGGTETNHAVTMARSKSRTGPWEIAPHNPVLSNRNTTEYFQTVGHADLFQDGSGHWWAVALSTRSGPEWERYPMGRETVLTPVTWEEGEWPVFTPVRGVTQGPLPEAHPVRNPTDRPEHLTFPPGSSIPQHLMYWRFPDEKSFVVSPRGHPNTLRVAPSDFGPSYDPKATTGPVSLVARRQTDTLFEFSVEVEIELDVKSGSAHVEAGVSVFLTQEQHIALSIVGSHGRGSGVVQLKTTGRGNFDGPLRNVTKEIPREWRGEKVRLTVEAKDDEEYRFSVSLASRPSRKVFVGAVDSRVVSGDTGRFTGTLVGVYASRGGRPAPSTSRGGKGDKGGDFAYFSNWRYKGLGQKIDHDLIVPSY